jgi:hypothetical protein
MVRAITLIAVLAACGGGNNNPAVDAAQACTTDTECPAASPVCDTGAGVCVQCNADKAMACTGATPACGPDETCHAACRADTDCASGVCLGDGSCAAPSHVLYVSRDVTAGTCTLADKCTLMIALGMANAAKDVIHLDPQAYHFTAGFSFTTDVTIVGIGASIAVDTGNVFSIHAQRTIKLDYFQLGGTPTTLPDQGVACTNGTLSVRGATIAFTNGAGINASGCTLRLERSTLHDNKEGAVLIGGGGMIAVFDNMIFKNGNATDATNGGIEFLGTVDAGSRLEFNTIVDNVAAATGTGGLICKDPQFVAPNNIVARNTPGQTTGPCTFPTSLVQADVTGLAFKSPDTAPLDYHLTAGSTAIDQATTASTVAYDVDFDLRPQGAQSDIGADEFKP